MDTETQTIVTIDISGTVLEGLKVLVKKADNGEWHWTAYASNGRKVATTGETYENQKHAANMGHELFPTAEVLGPEGTPWLFEAK